MSRMWNGDYEAETGITYSRACCTLCRALAPWTPHTHDARFDAAALAPARALAAASGFTRIVVQDRIMGERECFVCKQCRTLLCEDK